MTLRALKYGNYGIFPIMGNAGFVSSTVTPKTLPITNAPGYSPTPLTPQALVQCKAFNRFNTVLGILWFDHPYKDYEWIVSKTST